MTREEINHELKKSYHSLTVGAIWLVMLYIVLYFSTTILTREGGFYFATGIMEVIISTIAFFSGMAGFILFCIEVFTFLWVLILLAIRHFKKA